MVSGSLNTPTPPKYSAFPSTLFSNRLLPALTTTLDFGKLKVNKLTNFKPAKLNVSALTGRLTVKFWLSVCLMEPYSWEIKTELNLQPFRNQPTQCGRCNFVRKSLTQTTIFLSPVAGTQSYHCIQFLEAKQSSKLELIKTLVSTHAPSLFTQPANTSWWPAVIVK